ncbi:MAG: helix-turn-helix domain-containing protein [Verrucomicrobiota bacterium]
MNSELTTISSRLRERRLELGVSQVDLARLSGLSLHSVSDIETGKGNPTLDSLIKLLKVLGLVIRLEPSTGGAVDEKLQGEQP